MPYSLKFNNVERETRTGLQAAVLAGKAIMEVYGGHLGTTFKDDDSPVTLADKNAHEAILKTLETTELPVISEEMNLPEYPERKAWKRYWLVDPLDGTKEFVRGGTEFCVCIALMENDRPVMGIILIPVLKKVYLGDQRKGKVQKAELNDLDLKSLEEAEWQKLTPPRDTGKIRVAASFSHLSAETLTFIDGLKDRFGAHNIEVIRKGSAVKFILMAEGKTQIYPRFSPCMEWDTAAGQAICETMGMRMVSMADKGPFLYNKKELVNPAFLLTAAGIEL